MKKNVRDSRLDPQTQQELYAEFEKGENWKPNLTAISKATDVPISTVHDYFRKHEQKNLVTVKVKVKNWHEAIAEEMQESRVKCLSCKKMVKAKDLRKSENSVGDIKDCCTSCQIMPKKLSGRPDWFEARDGKFRCRLCRELRPDKLRSKKKVGWCRLCMGEEP